MLAADRRPQERGPGDAGPADGLALGVAQAAALVPGVSRNGATLTAARARRFTREHANLLSRTVALPVIVGATLLKGTRLRRRGVSPELGRAMAAGVGASFVSTLASQRLIGLVERDRALWPYAAYRLALAAVVARENGPVSEQDAYAARRRQPARTPTPRSRRWSRSLALIDTGKPSRVVPLGRPLRQRSADRRANRASPSAPTAWARRWSSPSSSGASRRSGSTASR